MRKFIPLVSLAMLCLTPVGTASAQNTSVNANVNIGSEDQRSYTSSRTYVVTVDGGKRDNRQEVFEEALDRAATKTLRNDYDWFRIIDRETSKETTKTESRSGFSARYERVPERRCGLLGCTTTYRDHYRGGFESDFPEREDTVYTVTLEFEMGSGPYANARNVYDARSIRNSNR